MSDTVPTRVHFFEHQFLRAVDFTAEQAYHLQGFRRHNLAGHRWGIVHGLEIVQDEGGGLTVQPGVAVDGYGRMLIRQVYQSLPTNAFNDQASDILEVWLLYDRRAGEAAPDGYAQCDDDREAYREIETARIEVSAPDPNQVSIGGTERPDGRRPLDVIPDDLDFGPQRTPPDDPALLWPVYLGQVTLDDAGEPHVDLEGRPYAGLVGESISSPSGEAFLQVGAEWPGDANRFALYLKEKTDDKLPPPSGTRPDLAINKDGDISIYHDTTLYGDLTIDGGAMVLKEGPVYEQEQPWRIYHTRAASVAQGGASVEQLRIEMAPLGSTGEVVIGRWSAQKKKFVPCLTIDNNCMVTVHGDLEIQGDLLLGGSIINIPQPMQAYVHIMAQEVEQRTEGDRPVLDTLVNDVKTEPVLQNVLLEMLAQNVIGGDIPAYPAGNGDVYADAAEIDTVVESVAAEQLETTEVEIEIVDVPPDTAEIEKETVDATPIPADAEGGDDRHLDVKDNLKLIKGIGREYEARLNNSGISTFESLADSSEEQLTVAIQPSRYHKPDYAAWRNEAAARSAAAAEESTGITLSEEESSSQD